MQILDVDVGVRLVRLEAFDALAHVAETDGVDRGDAHAARQLGADLLDRGLEVEVLLDEGVAAFVILLPERREPERPGMAHDELAELLLELCDDMAGRRLGEGIRLRRRRKASASRAISQNTFSASNCMSKMLSFAYLIIKGKCMK